MPHKLEQPRTISAIDVPNALIRLTKPIFGAGRQGKFVAVRKAGEGEKTKLGLYLGDLPLGVTAGFRANDPETLVVQYMHGNPAIFVFEDNQIVYGAESWWGAISGPDQLREITDGDIENVWYVQALRQMTEAKSDV